MSPLSPQPYTNPHSHTVWPARVPRWQGQTLAEFAITIPILLLLLFGVIEFARIFQAWVTLQNAARAGARYASVGQYDEDRFKMNLAPSANRDVADMLAEFIPCIPNDNRGTAQTFSPSPNDFGYTVNVFQGGDESLFATWNDGLDCDPANPDHQERRRDMARLLSIMDEARRGAAGLALMENTQSIPTETGAHQNLAGWPWFDVWRNPQPGSDQRGWFNVTICSTRNLNDRTADTYFERVQNGSAFAEAGRFVTFLGDTRLRSPDGQEYGTDTTPALFAPSCFLNEVPPATSGVTNNAGVPWMDPGGPSDTVFVIVSFNHPLITPLGIAEFIPIRAVRSAIVESYRAPSLGDAFDPPDVERPDSPTGTPAPPTPTTLPPSITPIPPTITRLPPTSLPTEPPAFSCDLITASGLEINGGMIFVDIQNRNFESTLLTNVSVNWPTITQYASTMRMVEMALNGIPHWKGADYADPNGVTNTTATNTDSSIPPNFFLNTSEADRTIAGSDSGTWTGTFLGGPTFLQQFVTGSDFSGTTFYLYNRSDPNNPCVIALNVPTLTPTPESGSLATDTPTFTPDCASQTISVRFAGFEPFGLVKLEVVNRRNTVAVLSDFTINWIQRAPGILTLSRVTAAAPFGQPNSSLVWRSGNAAGEDPNQDANPPTAGRAEGYWVSNYIFDAATGGNASVTSLYLDFDGVGSLLTDIGVTPSDFNGTNFVLSCGTGGGGAGGPGGGTGIIFLGEQPTPPPTNTRGPTRTPAPTFTPSKTFTPTPVLTAITVTPTPTLTRTPTYTPTPSPTKTPVPPPTQGDIGCTDNCS
ncbi:MAG: pilus assembly protein [Anaerolineae bacterium]|nr:pilus assembly protein [Anaerolineae bacterium]